MSAVRWNVISLSATPAWRSADGRFLGHLGEQGFDPAPVEFVKRADKGPR